MNTPNDAATCSRGHTEGARHACGYVDAVNKLIPAAAKAADERLAQFIEETGADAVDGWTGDDVWNGYYHEEMQAACELAGLRHAVPRAVREGR